MGFAVESACATEPEWPHVRCMGAADRSGRGWAWHDDPKRQACFTADAVAAPADLVADAIDGRALAGVDRLLTLARLREVTPGGFLRIFRDSCPACGGNHRERANRAVRTLKLIHPAAIELLREAQVPESVLSEPRYMKPGSVRAQDRQKIKYALPVWKGDLARTWMAQSAFAYRYALECGRSLGPRPPRQ